jgi:hypothetical protein
MNSGDWVESLTALVETHEGEWSIFQYPNYNLEKELEEIWDDQTSEEIKI